MTSRKAFGGNRLMVCLVLTIGLRPVTEAEKFFLKKATKMLDIVVFIFGIWHSQIRKNFNLNWHKKK